MHVNLENGTTETLTPCAVCVWMELFKTNQEKQCATHVQDQFVKKEAQRVFAQKQLMHSVARVPP